MGGPCLLRGVLSITRTALNTFQRTRLSKATAVLRVSSATAGPSGPRRVAEASAVVKASAVTHGVSSLCPPACAWAT
jgi:hypothetical protein